MSIGIRRHQKVEEKVSNKSIFAQIIQTIISLVFFHSLPLAVIAVLAGLGLVPLFKPGLFTAHDIWHQVARLYHYSEALQDGQVFPLWVGTLAHGFGYPLFIFSYHFPWWLAQPALWLGADVRDGVKWVLGISFLFSGWSWYWFGWQAWRKRLPSAVGAILYLWAPYHFLSLYVSAAVGTVVAFALLPLLPLSALWLWRGRFWGGSAVLSLALTALLLTHSMTVAMVLPTLGFAGAVAAVMLGWQSSYSADWRKRVWIVIKGSGLALVVTGLLAAFYLVPLMTYLPLIKAQQPGSGLHGLYRSNFPLLKQLVYSRWGFGPITERASDGEISFQVGLAQWVAVAVLTFVLFFRSLRSRRLAGFGWETLCGFSVVIFLMLQLSAPLWKFGDSIISLDYPFRLLLVAVWWGSVAAAYLVAQWPGRWGWSAAALLIGLAVYSNRNHVRVNQVTDIPLDLYVRSETTTNTFHEYLPITASGDAMELPPNFWVFAPKVRVEVRKALGYPDSSSLPLWASATLKRQTTLEQEITVTASKSGMVAFRQFGFPGVKLYRDNRPVPYQLDDRGLIMVWVDEGSWEMAIRYQAPLVANLGLGLSLFGVLVVLWIGYHAISENGLESDLLYASQNSSKAKSYRGYASVQRRQNARTNHSRHSSRRSR